MSTTEYRVIEPGCLLNRIAETSGADAPKQ
jgi:hypothetical protein